MLQTLSETPVATVQYALNTREQLKFEPQTLLSSVPMTYTIPQVKTFNQADVRQDLGSLQMSTEDVTDRMFEQAAQISK
jgi:hypothetical protein